MRSRQARQPGQIFLASRPLAGRDQNERQQRAEHDADAGADQALLDRIADQKDAAEGERYAADPDHPARAESLLKADRRRR
jgi:hypothetical protein